jgi:predicted ATPase
VQRIEVTPNAFGEAELRLVEDGATVPARLVSEGTLRILGFLAVASAPVPFTAVFGE